MKKSDLLDAIENEQNKLVHEIVRDFKEKEYREKWEISSEAFNVRKSWESKGKSTDRIEFEFAVHKIEDRFHTRDMILKGNFRSMKEYCEHEHKKKRIDEEERKAGRIPFRELWHELYPTMKEMRFGTEMLDEAAEIIDAIRMKESDKEKCIKKCLDRLCKYNEQVEQEGEEAEDWAKQDAERYAEAED